jgi:hypothetical protein
MSNEGPCTHRESVIQQFLVKSTFLTRASQFVRFGQSVRLLLLTHPRSTTSWYLCLPACPPGGEQVVNISAWLEHVRA